MAQLPAWPATASEAQTLRVRLLSALEQRLLAELEHASSQHAEVVAGATHGEAKAEHAKDTRATEQSYIARGYALRVAELSGEVAAVRACIAGARVDPTVRDGALVDVQDEDTGERQRLLIAAGGAGVPLEGWTVASAASALGAALLGCEADDVAEGIVAGRERAWSVRAVW